MIQEILDEQLASREDKTKKCWWFSDMGKCLSGVYYARLGKPRKELEPRKLRVFKAGNIFEDFLLEAISTSSKIKKLERPDKSLYLEEHDISGRPDGILTYLDESQEVLEVKTVHSDKFWWMLKKNEGPDQHYLMQLWWGMKATGIQKGRLIYISKDDLCIQEYELDITDPVGDRCLKEVGILNKAWKDQIPPEPQPLKINGKANWLATYCDYHEFCLSGATEN